ncbi:alcohol dehydrogenase catalytic domain-containing protein [Nocardia vulneris]|uniref:alcohol dehydrogenase catalytic domain-containing protein n=1 Tax=Nocardia vulneris TaxID=1141657 RepID=UPI003BB1E993
MMRALQLTEPGVLELREVPVPEIGPDELLLRVGAAGICHSDLHVLHLPFQLRAQPLTLGHEVAGTIEAVGAAVEGRSAGERGVVYLCWSCGRCRECASGNENCLPGRGPQCDAAVPRARSGRRHGRVPPHAGRRVRADRRSRFPAGRSARGCGADAVFDFVGNDQTCALAVATVAPNGAYRMIGLGGGTPEITAAPAGGPGWPWGASIRKSYGGTKSDLIESVALARSGKLELAVEQYALADGRAALDRLERGLVTGRAVVVP